MDRPQGHAKPGRRWCSVRHLPVGDFRSLRGRSLAAAGRRTPGSVAAGLAQGGEWDGDRGLEPRQLPKPSWAAEPQSRIPGRGSRKTPACLSTSRRCRRDCLVPLHRPRLTPGGSRQVGTCSDPPGNKRCAHPFRGDSPRSTMSQTRIPSATVNRWIRRTPSSAKAIGVTPVSAPSFRPCSAVSPSRRPVVPSVQPSFRRISA